MNTGQNSVTGVLMQVNFRDTAGNIIDTIKRPMQGQTKQGNSLAPDEFAKDPLKPNQSRPFRIAIDEIPINWNHRLPEIQIVNVSAE